MEFLDGEFGDLDLLKRIPELFISYKYKQLRTRELTGRYLSDW
jgi:hypothetical protein